MQRIKADLEDNARPQDDFVNRDRDDLEQVIYITSFFIKIKTIQFLNQENDRLKARNEQLESENRSMKKKMYEFERKDEALQLFMNAAQEATKILKDADTSSLNPNTMVSIHKDAPDLQVKYHERCELQSLGKNPTDAGDNVRLLLKMLFTQEELQSCSKKELKELPSGKEKVDFIYRNY